MAGKYKKASMAKTVYSAVKGMKQMKKRKVKTKAQKTKKKLGPSALGRGTAAKTASQAKSYYRKVNKY